MAVSSPADGTLDGLGARVLWLSPFYTNPPDAWVASDGVHMVTGYHGYWPIKAREVDPRWGGEAGAARRWSPRPTRTASASSRTSWCSTSTRSTSTCRRTPTGSTHGCVCGTNNCDWTVHRLDCLFASYLPNIDWTNPAGVRAVARPTPCGGSTRSTSTASASTP